MNRGETRTGDGRAAGLGGLVEALLDHQRWSWLVAKSRGCSIVFYRGREVEWRGN